MRKLLVPAVLLLASSALALEAPALPQDAFEPLSEDLPNFHQVEPWLYRGAQPSMEGLALLKRMGIKTIIDLREEDDLANAEGAEAARLGLRFIRIPMSGTFAPSKRQVDAFKDAINDFENYPIFAHCRRGADRTGAMMAMVRLDYDGWGVKRAVKEMREDGALEPLLIAWVYRHAYEENKPVETAAR